MARASTFPLVDRILGGQLEAELRQRRANGDSMENIARWLYIEHDVDVVGTTVYRWCQTLGIDTEAAAS